MIIIKKEGRSYHSCLQAASNKPNKQATKCLGVRGFSSHEMIFPVSTSLPSTRNCYFGLGDQKLMAKVAHGTI